MKYRFPWYLWAIVAFVVALGVTLAVSFYIDTQDIFFYTVSILLLMMIFAVVASVGGFFLGMIMSHRIISKGEFTPFEEEMLRMREEVGHLKAGLEKLIHHHGIEEKKAAAEPHEGRLKELEEAFKKREHELAERLKKLEEQLKEKMHIGKKE